MIQADADRHPLEAILEEYVERRRRGDKPSAQEYIERYPELADELRELLPTMMMVERARPQGLMPTEAARLEQLGDFRILGEIGRGGMGIVYEAEQESLGRRVALKVLPRHAQLEPRQRQRFHREARSAARLHHTNIVPVYGVSDHEGLPYYVMQLIHGHSLEQEIVELRYESSLQKRPQKRSSKSTDHEGTGQLTEDLISDEPASSLELPPALPIHDRAHLLRTPRDRWRWVARIGIQVAQALDYAHRQGIVHRDIKPSNLLLDPTGRVWITDFGLAKELPAHPRGGGGSDFSATGELAGTLAYLPPERFRGQVDSRGDLYSLGLTLYELVALRPAFNAPDRLQLLEQVTRANPPRLRRLVPDLPRDLETIIHKAIQKEPEGRYATAGELAADLERFLTDRPIRARRTGVVEHGYRWCRRNPLVATLVGIIFALTIISFAIVAVGMEEAVAQKDTIRRERDETLQANRRLRENSETLRQTIYAARMNNAEHTYAAPNGLRRTRQLLGMLVPEPWESDLRGFEWHYLHRLCHPDAQVLTGHDSPIAGLAYPADGRNLISAGNDGTLRIWDATSGRELARWSAHARRIDAFACSADGQWIATAGQPVGPGSSRFTNEVVLWDPARRAARRKFTFNPTQRASSLAVDPQGKRLAVGLETRTAGEGSAYALRIYDTSTGEMVLERSGLGLTVAYTPDGRRILAAALSGSPIVLDATTGQEVRKLEGECKALALQASPDGRWFAAGHANGAILWDAATGARGWEFTEKLLDFRCLAFTPDGSQLAAGSGYDGNVHLLDRVTGKAVRLLRGHDGAVVALAFAPDGMKIATGATDRTVLLRPLAEPVNPLALQASVRGSAVAVGFSTDGSRVISGYQLVDAKDRSVRGETRTWALNGGEILWKAAALCSNGHCVNICGDRVILWTVEGAITVRGIESGQETLAIPEDTRLAQVLLGKNCNVLVTVGLKKGGGGNGYVITVRDGLTGAFRHQFTPGDCPLIQAAVLTPDEQYLAVFGSSGVPSAEMDCVIWRLTDGQEAARWRVPLAGWPGPLSAGISPDGSRVVLSFKDRVARMVELWSGRELFTLQGHTGLVHDAQFSPDGRRIATASIDKTVKLWDTATGLELMTLRGDHVMNCVAFSDDGHRLAAGCGSRVLIWDAQPQEPCDP